MLVQSLAYDAAAGIYIVRRRWLEPPLGCWLSRDPVYAAPASALTYMRQFANRLL